MRNLLFKSFAILLTASALMFTGCNKDDSVSTVVGVWVADSFTADGAEMLGTFFTSVEMEVGEMTENTGSWRMTADVLGLGADTETGTYIMNESDNKITVTVDGDITVFDYELNGNTLKFTTTDVDNIFYVVNCTRK